MRRAVLYARYSTDLQADRSIDDQVAVLRAYAAREAIAIVGTFEDRAVSGASMHGRPGIQALMSTVRAGGVDLVLVESLSRLGRDKEDRAGIHKRLKSPASRS